MVDYFARHTTTTTTFSMPSQNTAFQTFVLKQATTPTSVSLYIGCDQNNGDVSVSVRILGKKKKSKSEKKKQKKKKKKDRKKEKKGGKQGNKKMKNGGNEQLTKP